MTQNLCRLLRYTFAVCSALLFISYALPGDSQISSLGLTPSVSIIHARFGETVKETMSLTNMTKTGITFELYAQDVVVKNGKRQFVPAGELVHSIASSAVFSLRSGFVAPSTTEAVQILLTIPAQTAQRAVVIYFRSKRAALPGSSLGMSATLGSLVTFILSPDLSLVGETIRVVPATATENLKVLEVLKNTGSEPVVPNGVAVFVNDAGTLVGKIAFLRQRLLPGEQLDFVAAFPGHLKPGEYHVLCTFSYEARSVTNTVTFTVR